MNYFLKILSFLKEFEGDGEYYPIEDLFENSDRHSMQNVIKSLEEDNLIKVRPGSGKQQFKRRSLGLTWEEAFNTNKISEFRNQKPVGKYLPYEALIMPKGVLHLSKLSIKNEITIIGNNNNAIQDSPHAHLQAPNSDSIKSE